MLIIFPPFPPQMYLARFGYMDPAATNPQSGALLSQEAVRDSIIDFQVSWRLSLDPILRTCKGIHRIKDWIKQREG